MEPSVLFDGTRTGIALRQQGAQTVLLTLDGGLQTVKLSAEWRVLSFYPVGLAAVLYNSALCGNMRSPLVERELRRLLTDEKYAYNLEHIMANEAKEKEAVKGQDTAAAAKKGAAKATKEAGTAKPAAKTPAKGKAAEAAKPAAKTPAKTPAKAAPAAAAEGGRKGRPPSFDVTTKLKKGATKLDGTVREGTVREALMKAIINGVGKPVQDVLGAQATDAGHTVKAVDINFAVEAGYVAL